MSLKPIDFYDAKKWDINEARSLQQREEKAIKVIETYKKKGLKVLDIGCGDGLFLQELADHVSDKRLDLHGVDYSKYKVQQAKKLHSGMTFAPCNLEEGIPYPDKSFDVVYSGEVIEHLYNPDLMIEECYRVLKKGGTLIISTPNFHAWYNRVLFFFGVQPIFYETSTKSAKIGAGPMKRLKTQTVPVGHIRLFNKHALRDMLEAEGFIVSHFIGSVFHALPKPVQPLDRAFNTISSFSSNLTVVAEKE
jgi:ubiquinone/menaquinone biosynthesis C-methylase UbiE